MQKLIMKSYHGDGCRFSCTAITPFLCESTTAAAITFNDSRLKANGKCFKFLEVEFCEEDIRYTGSPDFFTLDEWFNGCKWC